jgi:uncharacterized protein YceK
MRKLCLTLIAALALSSCDSVLAYWAPKTPYTLTAEDRAAIALVFGESLVSRIEPIIYTKDLPYGNYVGGMYSLETGEIWLNENGSLGSVIVAHEVTHYYQHKVRGEDIEKNPNKNTLIPDDLSVRLGPEEEAYLVEDYIRIKRVTYRTYIDEFLLIH